MKEVEVLFRIDDERAQMLRDKLKDCFVQHVRETDTYFYPPHKDFSVTENGRENLRVRQSVNRNELTYKNVRYKEGKYTHSIEKNARLDNGEDAIEILSALGFRVHFVVDKSREIFQDGDYKITIDDVQGLGIFVEVEWSGKEGDESELQTACISKARELGLDKVQDKGYLTLLEEKR